MELMIESTKYLKESCGVYLSLNMYPHIVCKKLLLLERYHQKCQTFLGTTGMNGLKSFWLTSKLLDFIQTMVMIIERLT